jgi:hypothetical protein
MNPTSFTVEQENLLCIFNTSTRAACMGDIALAMRHFDDPDMRDIAESTLAVLQTMTDVEFSAYQFSPAYHNDDDEGEV